MSDVIEASSGGVQTQRIQAAIDRAAAAGGGTVVIPPGRVVTGTLQLRDHVTLHLEGGARLEGSSDRADYPEIAGSFTDAVGQRRNRCLIYAVGASGVGISGQGVIDGNGGAFGRDEDGRPFLLRMVDCRDVRVTGVTLRNSPGWVSHYLGCENVFLSGLTIHSHANSNNDGIDLDSCRRVRVAACDLDCGDDAICIKATRATPSEHIVVTGCVLRSVWGAIKLGTESVGDFRHVVVADCTIRDTHGGGVKLISMDGARMEHVSIRNLTFDGVSGPLFVRLGARLRRYHADQPQRPVGVIRDVTLSQITGRVWEEGYPLYGRLPRRAGIILTGIPGHDVEDVRLEGLRLDFPGGGTEAEAARHNVPEQEAEYPEFPSFHPLPSWGVFLRHFRRVTLRDVDLRLEAPDARPALVADRPEELQLFDVRAEGRRITANEVVRLGG